MRINWYLSHKCFYVFLKMKIISRENTPSNNPESTITELEITESNITELKILKDGVILRADGTISFGEFEQKARNDEPFAVEKVIFEASCVLKLADNCGWSLIYVLGSSQITQLYELYKNNTKIEVSNYNQHFQVFKLFINVKQHHENLNF